MVETYLNCFLTLPEKRFYQKYRSNNRKNSKNLLNKIMLKSSLYPVTVGNYRIYLSQRE